MIDFIIVNTKEDTNEFGYLLNNIVDCNVLINPSKNKVRAMLESSQNDLVLYGHGWEFGLFNVNQNGELVGENEVDMLRKRNVVGLWCYAGNFADKYNLHGFFTSMFISNIDEANYLQVPSTPEVIKEEVVKFNRLINELLKSHTPYSQWVEFLQKNVTPNCPVASYNYEALSYYE